MGSGQEARQGQGGPGHRARCVQHLLSSSVMKVILSCGRLVSLTQATWSLSCWTQSPGSVSAPPLARGSAPTPTPARAAPGWIQQQMQTPGLPTRPGHRVIWKGARAWL